MKGIEESYNSRKEIAANNIASETSKTNLLVLARLVTFMLIIGSVYYLWGQVLFVFPAVILLSLLFGFLIKFHENIKIKRDYWKAVFKMYENELKGLEGDYSWAGNGNAYKPEHHEFAHDIDILGNGSFFQRINRAATNGGEKFLAQDLLSNDITDISLKQTAIKELAGKTEFKEAFLGSANMNQSDLTSDVLTNWFSNYKPLLSKSIYFLLILFPLFSVVLIVGLAMEIVPSILFGGWFCLGIVIIGMFLKNVIKFNSDINKVADNIKSFEKLLNLIDNEKWESELLLKLQREVQKDNMSATQNLKSFVKKVDLFNNRNNLLVGIFGNALLLWDMQTIFRLERWIETNKSFISTWVSSIYQFDAYISKSIYTANNPSFQFPTILTDGGIIIDAQKLGHPMIKRTACVTSDVRIDKDNFLIITGANMAGKSTFLRTISLSIVMTNAGLPIFADRISIMPQKLISSMRTSDSLLEEESYFFAELKRLKYIIDIIKQDQHFIILDEILKGTNSKDKEQGSKQFLEKLISLHATGIIATHDLGLCEVASSHQCVQNFYFDAEIVNDELHFDYKMKDGICKNMNASFLLRKMEIV